MRDGSWSRQRTKSRAFSRVGSRRGLARTVVQQKVATAMALSSLQALGFGICAPVSPSSCMSPWQERPNQAKGPFTWPSTLTARPGATPINSATFRHSSHGGTCCSPPSGCQARSRQRRWPEGPGFTARWWGADNRTCDQITRTQPLHLRFFAIGQVLRHLCADSHSR